MALDATKLQYAGNGEVYVAPVGTAMPTTHSVALNAAFLGLGYVTEDGVTVTPSTDTNEVRAWQSAYAIDTRVTARNLEISFTALELNKNTFGLTFGGGSWALAGSTYTFTPPAAEAVDYRAIVFHLVDGAQITRFLIPKLLVSDPGAIQIQRSTPSEISMTMRMIATGVGDPFTVLSSDAKYA